MFMVFIQALGFPTGCLANGETSKPKTSKRNTERILNIHLKEIE